MILLVILAFWFVAAVALMAILEHDHLIAMVEGDYEKAFYHTGFIIRDAGVWFLIVLIAILFLPVRTLFLLRDCVCGAWDDAWECLRWQWFEIKWLAKSVAEAWR